MRYPVSSSTPNPACAQPRRSTPSSRLARRAPRTKRHASAHTVAANRDTWRLLLGFTAEQTGATASELDLAVLDAPLIAAFLNHLERDRGNSVRTRNARLAAIHSLFQYAALHHPEHAACIARMLAIPPKQFDRALLTYLTDDEIDAQLAAPDRDTLDRTARSRPGRPGCPDRVAVSELTGLTCADVHLGVGAHVSCHGKGRQDRITPLTTDTVAALRGWLTERGSAAVPTAAAAHH